MIYKHKFLKNILVAQSTLKQITKTEPLMVILAQGQFLHFTIEKSLTYLKVPHQITRLIAKNLQDNRKSMEHEVPTMIFSDQILETEQVIQFLCDAFSRDEEMLDFQSRKALIKDIVKIWKEIFLFEKFYPFDFSKLKHLGVKTKKDYQNLVLQQLQRISMYFQNKILKRAYNDYSEQIPTLETILFVDLINTIINKTQQSFADYTLRSHFGALIQLKIKYAKMIQDHEQGAQIKQHFVILQQPALEQKVEWESRRVNGKKFILAFGIVGLIYSIFIKF